MNRKKKQLIVLGLLLVLCIGGYLGVKAYNDYASDQERAAEKAAKTKLCDLERITSLSYHNSQGDFSFQLKDGSWVYLPDEDFPLSQDDFESLVYSLKALTADRSFAAGESLSSYGLDAPAYRLTAGDAEGKTLTLLIGNSAEDGSGVKSYYVMKQNGDQIHTVASRLVDFVQYALNDWVELETFPSLNEDSIHAIQLKSGNHVVQLEKETVAQESDEEEPAEQYVWYLNKNGVRTAAGEEIKKLLSQIYGLSFQSCVNYKASPQDLAQYGLSEPQLSLTVAYTEANDEKQTTQTEFTLHIGLPDQEGSAHYARKDGSAMVNLISAQTVTTLSDYVKSVGD